MRLMWIMLLLCVTAQAQDTVYRGPVGANTDLSVRDLRIAGKRATRATPPVVHRRFLSLNQTVVKDADAGYEWNADYSTRLSIASNATAGYIKYGAASVKLTHPNDATATRYRNWYPAGPGGTNVPIVATALDTITHTAESFAMWVYLVNQVHLETSASALQLQFHRDATGTNYYAYNIANTVLKEGWNLIRVPAPSSVATSSTGAAAWGVLHHITIGLVGDLAGAGQPIDLYVSGMWLTEPTRGNVCWCFDSVDATIATTFAPILARYGWVGCILPDFMQSDGTTPLLGTGVMMTETQLRALYDAGWDVSMHGYAQSESYATSADAATYVRRAKAWLSGRGYHRGSNYCSFYSNTCGTSGASIPGVVPYLDWCFTGFGASIPGASPTSPTVWPPPYRYGVSRYGCMHSQPFASGLIVDVGDVVVPPTRANTTAYDIGMVVLPSSPAGYQYRCTAATGSKQSGGSAPTWPTTVGNTVADGDLTWTCEVSRVYVVTTAATTKACASVVSPTDFSATVDATNTSGQITFTCKANTYVTPWDVTGQVGRMFALCATNHMTMFPYTHGATYTTNPNNHLSGEKFAQICAYLHAQELAGNLRVIPPSELWEETYGSLGHELQNANIGQGLTDRVSPVLLTQNLVAKWLPLHAYVVGERVRPSTANSCVYLCTTAGTSLSAEPESWGTTLGGTTAESGGPTWTCEADVPVALEESKVW